MLLSWIRMASRRSGQSQTSRKTSIWLSDLCYVVTLSDGHVTRTVDSKKVSHFPWTMSLTGGRSTPTDAQSCFSIRLYNGLERVLFKVKFISLYGAAPHYTINYRWWPICSRIVSSLILPILSFSFLVYWQWTFCSLRRWYCMLDDNRYYQLCSPWFPAPYWWILYEIIWNLARDYGCIPWSWKCCLYFARISTWRTGLDLGFMGKHQVDSILVRNYPIHVTYSN